MQMYSLLPVNKLSGYSYNIVDPVSNPCTPEVPFSPFPIQPDWPVARHMIDVYSVFRVSAIKGWYFLRFQAII